MFVVLSLLTPVVVAAFSAGISHAATNTPDFGDLSGRRLRSPVVGFAARPQGGGYWLVTARGQVYAFGAARPKGSLADRKLKSPIGGIAAMPDGLGYYLFGRSGRVSSPAVGIVATSGGRGYWTPLANGRVLAYGRAANRGGLFGRRFSGAVIGMDRRVDNDGYWLATSTGAVYPEPGTNLPPTGTPNLTVAPVVTGLTIPWDVAFLPNRTMLFTQRIGEINAHVGGSVRTLAAPGDVVVASEAGVMGLAIDPDFGGNRRVYVCMTSDRPAGDDDVRIVRFRVNGAVTALTNRTDIVTGLPVNTFGQLGRHSGCRPRFGPDGFLWVGTGDAAVGTVPQDDNSLGGKVLRVDTNGNAAPGNPGGRRWYTKGHRNVQGLAFQPGTGRPYSVEHGSFRDDEINLLVNGANYGWDPVPGYDESVPMTDLVKFPGARVAAWSSGNPTVATSGADFLVGDQWRDWSGALAVATLADSDLRFFRISGNGLTATRFAVRFDGTYGRLRSVVLGPNDALYLTTSNGGGSDQILRVTAS